MFYYPITDAFLARIILHTIFIYLTLKEREEREAKKIKADEEAAAIYAQFVASFEHIENDQAPMFVQVRVSSISACYDINRSYRPKVT